MSGEIVEPRDHVVIAGDARALRYAAQPLHTLVNESAFLTERAITSHVGCDFGLRIKNSAVACQSAFRNPKSAIYLTRLSRTISSAALVAARIVAALVGQWA